MGPDEGILLGNDPGCAMARGVAVTDRKVILPEKWGCEKELGHQLESGWPWGGWALTPAASRPGAECAGSYWLYRLCTLAGDASLTLH